MLATGAALALRRVAVERAEVLTTERELGKRLTELSQVRADFTAMVAHELASPVAALRGYSAMLATGTLDAHLQRQTAEAIRTEAELIGTLVEDVRTAASAECDDFELRVESAPYAHLLADAAAFARSLPGNHPVDSEIGTADRVRVDPERIAQVLRNLVGNACRHTPTGTPVTIRSIRHGDTVRIEVSDTGPGIHPDDMDQIFEKFGRGRATIGQRTPGIGLGLYLSRQIIQAHGSELGVKSIQDVGTTFWFEMQIAQ